AATRRRRAPVPGRARPSPRGPGRAPRASRRATPAPASRADRAAPPARPRAAARPPSRLPPRPRRERRPPLARRAAWPLLPRAARGLRIEPRKRLLQLPQPRRQLRRHRALQQLLDFAQPRLERRVAQPGGLGRARDLFHRARQLLNPLLQRLLLARDRLRALR